MSAYDFSLFSVLIVEDGAYMRRLLSSVLRAIGVGTVLQAANGGEAIEMMKLMGTHPDKVGVSSVDIVMSNWMMDPVDGLMLLRWLRRNKESPDRFMAFIMITGFVDRGKLVQARDHGVIEFLAKPYSVQALVSRLLAVIDRPREFVLAPDYFGPDRRRRALDYAGGERRELDDSDVDVVYAEPAT
jgi:two-component system chemotaxis response regulator CheY